MAAELLPVIPDDLLDENGKLVTDDGVYYSASAIAALHIKGFPKSRAGVYKRAEKEGWPVIHRQGRGARDGVKYFKPPIAVSAAAGAKQYATETSEPIMSGSGQLNGHAVGERIKAEADDFVYIDKYVNVLGAAGAGQEVHDEAIVQVRMDAQLLRERVGNNFSKIKIAGVSGDSMYPTLSHGDQVLVDTSVDRFIENAIYAIQQDGHLRFKRIQLKLDGSIIVKSDNPNFNEPEIYTADEAQYFKVVGVVFPFKFGRFKI